MTNEISAYIDGANLHRAMSNKGIILDYVRFRVWLMEKHQVSKAFLFLGYIQNNQYIYRTLQESGFILIFKETVKDPSGNIKGNCDSDLVLQAVSDFYEKKYQQCIIVSSDGDFSGLAKLLSSKNALKCIISPASKEKCSILLKKLNLPITFLSDPNLLIKFTRNKKAPRTDGTV